MWNTTTWHQIAVLTEHTHYVYGIAISPNGRILASASWDYTARLWNLENGQLINQPLQHSDIVNCVSFSPDGKLLVTGCDDHNAYSWDVEAIVRGAGLDELLLNPKDDNKSFLEADVALRPRRHHWHGYEGARLPQRFFDDSPPNPHFSASRQPPSSTSGHHPTGPTLLARVSLLFRRTAHRTPTRNPSGASHGRNTECTELQEHRPAIEDVPFAQGKPRNYSKRELLMKRKKEREKALAAKNAPAANLRPHSSVNPQSSGAILPQPSSEPHVAQPLATSSTAHTIAAAPVVTASTSSPPDAVIPRAGRWTRFRLFICCLPAQYIDGHD